MKNLPLIICLLSTALTYAQKKKPMPSTYDLLIGSYTSGTSKGIAVYRFYAETGKLAYLNQVTGIDNPSYLCVAANNKFVYSVSESSTGEVNAFTFEPKTGKLGFINKQKSEGMSPCYISVDKDQKNIFVANYSSGTLAVLPLNKDGSIKPASQVIQDKGGSINKARQAGPHVHTAVLSPDEKYLLYTDLGTDKLNILRYKDSKIPPLTSPLAVSVKPGSGPRHLDFSPDGKYVYLLREITGAITAYAYDSGNVKEIQDISILSGGFAGQVGAADIHVSPDGRFLYASNRGDANEIVVFAINQENGMLTFIERGPSMGRTPRNFVIDPTGRYLLIANQETNTVFVYKIDKNTGKLFPTGIKIEVGNPVCLKFAPAE